MTFLERLSGWAQWVADQLASVQAVAPGLESDGLIPVQTSGTKYDRDYATLVEMYEDALAAWRANPLAKRIVGLVSAYVVGDGIQLASTNPDLDRFIQEWWGHDGVRMLQRQTDWCDELTRAGELFPILFPDDSGYSYLRAKPASLIREVEYMDGDYETETGYIEVAELAQLEGRRWKSLFTAGPEDAAMLHFAINRPVGCIRGEGDLGQIIKWLRRYDRWLEDRVRLNAGVRSFLWVVKAAKRLIPDLKKTYAEPPSPGSVIFADPKDEEWEVVSPTLHANDAAADGRAIRWMIVAGAPGISLVDLGEADDANLATAQAMKELRRRFLRQRQIVFATILADVTLAAYRRYRGEKRWRGKGNVTLADIVVDAPDISPEDNAELASAAGQIVTALQNVQTMIGDSREMREAALRMFAKFAGESFTETEFDRIIEEGEKYLDEQRQREQELADRQFEASQNPANQSGSGSSGDSGNGNGSGTGSASRASMAGLDQCDAGQGPGDPDDAGRSLGDDNRGPRQRTGRRVRHGRVQFKLTPEGIFDLIERDRERDSGASE